MYEYARLPRKRPNHSALTFKEMGHKGQILRPPYNSSDPFRYRILTYVQLSHHAVPTEYPAW
jgi:hypothetical protein